MQGTNNNNKNPLNPFSVILSFSELVVKCIAISLCRFFRPFSWREHGSGSAATTGCGARAHGSDGSHPTVSAAISMK